MRVLHDLWFQVTVTAVVAMAWTTLVAVLVMRRKLDRYLSGPPRGFREMVISQRRILIALGVDPYRDNPCTACGGSGQQRRPGFIFGVRPGRPAGHDPARRGERRAGTGEDTEVLPAAAYLASGDARSTPAGDVDATRADGGQWSGFTGRYTGEPSSPGTVRYFERPEDDIGNTLGAFPWGDGAKRHR